MSERDYLDHYAQITADNVEATIESRNDDGSYIVREVASRARLRASPANPVDSFALNSRVVISRPSASRSVIGAGAIIISRAPRDQRGLSGSTPAESRDFHERPVILSVDPDPLVLEAGGAPGAQTIIGRGLTQAATYVRRSALYPEPLVTETSPPDVEPEQVVMTISADADSPLGLFSLTIGVAAARDALRIISTPAPLYVVTGDDAGSTCYLWILNATNLSIMHTVTVTGTFSVGIVYHDGLIYWTTTTSNFVHQLHVIDPITAAITSMPFATGVTEFQMGTGASNQLKIHNGKLITNGANPSLAAVKGLWRFDLDGTNGVRVWTDATSFQRSGITVAPDGSIYVSGSAGVAKLSSAYALVATTGTGASFARVTLAGLSHIVVGNTGTPIRWRDVGLGAGNTFADGAIGFGVAIAIGDRIYFSQGTTLNLYSASIDGSDVDLVGTIPAAPVSLSLVTDGAALIYTGTDRVPRRCSTVGALLATGAAISSDTGMTIREAILIPEDEL